MAEDPYKVLGVQRDASDDDIRSAYRKLAKELHPDLNPANRASAEERFKKVSAAYEIVGDATKRGQYDRGEIDANGEQRRAYHRAHAGGSRGGGRAAAARSSASATSFPTCSAPGGGARAASSFGMRGRDVRYTLEVDFLEAATGAKKRVTMPDGGVLDITVPEGVADGQTLRLKGKGRRARAAASRAMRWSRSKCGRTRCSSARATTSRSICRSPSTRRCSAPRSRCRPSPAACS